MTATGGTKSDRDLIEPHLDLIRRVSDLSGEDPFRFAALGLRESEWGHGYGYHPKGSPTGWGDHGYAFGWFQLDRRWHRPFIDSAAAQDPFNQAMYACRLLREARSAFKRSHSFGSESAEMLERATFAAYNAGFGRVLHAIVSGADPDSVTTKHDYSRWIFKRAEDLRYAEPHLFDVAAKVAV